jgi:sulfur-oxidizing protein SoxX
LNQEEIRQRLIDPARFNPKTIMPAYSKTEGLTRVAPSLRGKTLLSPEQVEDVVAYLATLK